MAGRPFFVIPLDLGAIITGNEAAGFPASNLKEPGILGLKWKTSGNTNVWVRGSFGVVRDIDFMAIVSANAIPATKFRLRLASSLAAVDGVAAYDSGSGGQAFINPSITRVDGLYHAHFELPSLQSQSFWRLDITGHTGDFSASSVILGRKVQPATYYEPNWGAGVLDTGSVEIGRLGVPETLSGVKLRTLDFRLQWISESEYETAWRPFDEAIGRTGLVFCAFDPDATTYRQARTYMGWLRENPTAQIQRARKFDKSFGIVSVI